MSGRRLARPTTKADMRAWVDAQLTKDARLRAQVDVRLNRFRLEQELARRREGRRLSEADRPHEPRRVWPR
jgi:hypothetical protein